jgi:hypothetical protein
LLRRLLVGLALVFCASHLQAQNVEGQIVASQFGEFQVPGIAVGSLQFEPSTCQVVGGGKNFAAFTAGVPVKIVDSNPALNEFQTPSAVFISQCAVSMATTYIHALPFYLTSGTGGLQEALNNGQVKAGGPNTVILNSEWYGLIAPQSAATVIASVHGSTSLGLVDVTTTPYTAYGWNGSQYVSQGTGAAIPATGGVLVTSGNAGQAAATLNLPANTAAVSQTPSDASTKVATDAYVHAQNSVNQFPPATQYVQQPLDNTFFTSFNTNFANKVFFVDGFSSYGGVGVAPIAFSSPSTDFPECQVVTYSGNAYIALNATNHTTIPGTFSGVWYPLPVNTAHALASTNADCAWYFAVAYMSENHQSAMIEFGAGHYTSNLSFWQPVDGNSFDDEFSVSARGCGSGCTYIVYGGTANIPLFNRPTGGANFTSMDIDNMTLDGGGVASAIIELGTLGQSYFRQLAVGHVQPGADHVLEFGHFGGDAFQVFPTDINIGVYPDSGTQNCGTFTANVVGGAITSYTVNSGGDCYNTYAGSVELTVVALQGSRGGAHNTPCGTMPDPPTVTIVGHAVTAITPGAGTGATCSGVIGVQVYQTPNVNYGMIMNASDSTAKDVVSYDGSIAAFQGGGGNDTFIHFHPSVVFNGVVTTGGIHLVATEIDDVGGCGFIVTQPFDAEGTSFEGTNAYIGGDRLLPGSSTYCFTPAPTVLRAVTIGASGSLCSANPGGGEPVDWHEFLTPTGPIVSPSDYAAKVPAGLSVLGNDVTCGETMGDYVSSTLNVGTLNVTNFTPSTLFIPPTGTATSGANFGTPANSFGPQVSYWNGSTHQLSTAFNWTTVGTGSNPAIADNFLIYPCPSQCIFSFQQQVSVSALLSGYHIGSSVPSGPTAAAGTGAGTSPTGPAVVAFGSDLTGYITLTTGASPTASAIVFTITFNQPYSFPGPKCWLWPANAATQALTGTAGVQIFPADIDTGGTTAAARAGATALAGATAYEWGYGCTQ